MENTQNRRSSGAFVGGAILIAIGLVALTANLGGGSYIFSSIPLAIGAAFLVAYALTRQYGFLVPGGILSGVGAGTLASSVVSAPENGVYAVLAIALGFILIFAVDVLVTRTTVRWWPLIPGGVMFLVGAAMARDSEGWIQQVQVWSPVVLIAIGLLIVIARLREPRS